MLQVFQHSGQKHTCSKCPSWLLVRRLLLGEEGAGGGDVHDFGMGFRVQGAGFKV